MGRLTRNDRQVPDGWQVVRLGDVLKLEYGVSLPQRQRLPGRVPVMGSAGRVGFHSQASISGPGIVVGRKGSIGTITWVSDDFVPIDTTYVAVPVDGLADLLWVYHLLSREDLSKLNRATGVPGLNRDDVYALIRLLPPLPEQRAIATVLDSIDEAIERTEAVIAATERLRDALLHELLTSGVPGWHTEWMEVPGIGNIPADWEVVRLGDVAEVQTGRAVNRKATRNGNLQVPYLSVANVKDGHLDLSVVKTMLVSESEVKRYRLRDGDVLLTEGGDADKLGRGTVWRDEISPCLHQNHIFAVRPSQGVLHSNFLASFVGSAQGKRFFLGAAKQTTNLASINSSQLKRMPTPLPNFSEQARVVEVLSAIDEAINLARTQYEGLQSLKAATADALLTGRMKVSSQV